MTLLRCETFTDERGANCHPSGNGACAADTSSSRRIQVACAGVRSHPPPRAAEAGPASIRKVSLSRGQSGWVARASVRDPDWARAAWGSCPRLDLTVRGPIWARADHGPVHAGGVWHIMTSYSWMMHTWSFLDLQICFWPLIKMCVRPKQTVFLQGKENFSPKIKFLTQMSDNLSKN